MIVSKHDTKYFVNELQGYFTEHGASLLFTHLNKRYTIVYFDKLKLIKTFKEYSVRNYVMNEMSWKDIVNVTRSDCLVSLEQVFKDDYDKILPLWQEQIDIEEEFGIEEMFDNIMDFLNCPKFSSLILSKNYNELFKHDYDKFLLYLFDLEQLKQELICDYTFKGIFNNGVFDRVITYDENVCIVIQNDKAFENFEKSCIQIATITRIC